MKFSGEVTKQILSVSYFSCEISIYLDAAEINARDAIFQSIHGIISLDRF